MALLAKVVHSQYSIYSLFKRNCYWFALLIYLAAKNIDQILGSGEIHEDPGESDDSEMIDDSEMTDDFFVPFYLYASNLAGRWMGFKVCDVKDVVLGRIVRLFLKQLEEHEAELDKLKTKDAELETLKRQVLRLERLELLESRLVRRRPGRDMEDSEPVFSSLV